MREKERQKGKMGFTALPGTLSTLSVSSAAITPMTQGFVSMHHRFEFYFLCPKFPSILTSSYRKNFQSLKIFLQQSLPFSNIHIKNCCFENPSRTQRRQRGGVFTIKGKPKNVIEGLSWQRTCLVLLKSGVQLNLSGV